VKLIVLDATDNQYETPLPFVAVIKALFLEETIADYNLVAL
jgi:hypothetical protein